MLLYVWLQFKFYFACNLIRKYVNFAFLFLYVEVEGIRYLVQHEGG